VVKPDFFVLSGLQGLKKFYIRGTFKGDEVRVMTILYDQATENTVEPVVIAMSSAFNAFPGGPQAGPAPRKTVEYGTGVVAADDGSIVTDRQIVEGCLAIAIPGFGNADRIAEDKERDLALLRRRCRPPDDGADPGRLVRQRKFAVAGRSGRHEAHRGQAAAHRVAQPLVLRDRKRMPGGQRQFGDLGMEGVHARSARMSRSSMLQRNKLLASCSKTRILRVMLQRSIRSEALHEESRNHPYRS
jgi:hypothetical protein